ncbi:unnamed protein product [Symbiodinium sp. CCMP2592]|nr:unnamed protein product [Symbiodinium sp. CCMP2592]
MWLKSFDLSVQIYKLLLSLAMTVGIQSEEGTRFKKSFPASTQLRREQSPQSSPGPSMRMSLAEKLLEELDPENPSWLKLEWVKALAALSAVHTHTHTVERISPGPSRKICDLQLAAASAL